MLYPDLRQLTVCRNLLKDSVIGKLAELQAKERYMAEDETEEVKSELLSLRSELAEALVQQVF